MARQARGKSMDPAKVQVFHTVQRCVRRAFLCGEDTVSGKSYDHRKQWIRVEMPYAASLYFGGFNARAVLKELSLPSPTTKPSRRCGLEPELERCFWL